MGGDGFAHDVYHLGILFLIDAVDNNFNQPAVNEFFRQKYPNVEWNMLNEYYDIYYEVTIYGKGVQLHESFVNSLNLRKATSDSDVPNPPVPNTTPESQVFNMSEFDPAKCYGYAIYTRKDGISPNETYYTTNPIQYLGKFISNNTSSSGDITFEKSTLTKDDKNYFVEVPCGVGGKRTRKRKNKKTRKKYTQMRKSMKN